MRKRVVTLVISTFVAASIIQAAEDVHISSLIFFDLTYDASGGTETSFNLKRSYLTYRKDVSDNLRIRITADASTSRSGPISVFVKYAFAAWNSPIGTVQMGVQPTNYFGPIKANWGNRFIEKFPADLYGFDATSDLGLSLKKQVSPRLLVHGAVYNGPGYKKPENDTFKRSSLLISYGKQDLRKETGWNAGTMTSIEPYESGDGIRLKLRQLLFVGVASEKLRGGGEVHLLKDNGTDNRAFVGSAYGTFRLRRQLNLVARVDIYDPYSGRKNDRKTFLICGINFQPEPNFSFAPNIRYTRYQFSDKESDLTLKLNFEFKF